MMEEPNDSGSPLRFSNEAKIRKQMKRRGWTELDLRDALQTAPIPWQGQNGPALRYLHPVNGRTVLVDASNGEIFHVGGEGFLYDD